jgi:high-affinity Fe2+/Pb2+ permease
MTTPLPTTRPSDEHAGGGILFAGLAIPYMLGALVIAAGMVVGGTVGFAMAYGTLLLLILGVVVGIVAFIHTDDED